MEKMFFTWDVLLKMHHLSSGFLILAQISIGKKNILNHCISFFVLAGKSLNVLLFKILCRRCYGNFFCCDDQKMHRNDSIDHEEVDVPLKTDYLGNKKA